MRFIFVILLFPIFCFCDPYPYHEVWAYVYNREEKGIRKDLPITDIAHFSVAVNEIGRLTASLDPSPVLERAKEGIRTHLVISCPYNRSLLYWCLKKDLETRDLLINDIVKVSSAYDGVQIDFESVRAEEGEAYVSFLKELRAKLPKKKILSVALLARVREMNDGYHYKKIGELVDRVIIMAYDEHYRSSAPGALASIPWCQRVSSFAIDQIPKEKLIMGLPLYGRIWQKQCIAKDLKYPQTLDLWKKVGSLVNREEDGTPYFSFQELVEGTVYYEDAISLKNKLQIYSEKGVQSVAFWRLTQEPAALWKHIVIETN